MELLVVESKLLVTAFAAPFSPEAQLLTVLAYNGVLATVEEDDAVAESVAAIPGARIGGVSRSEIRTEAEDMWLRLHDKLGDVPPLGLVTSPVVLLDVISEVGELREQLDDLEAWAIHDAVRLHTIRYVTREKTDSAIRVPTCESPQSRLGAGRS
jgi:hypothetical protein